MRIGIFTLTIACILIPFSILTGEEQESKLHPVLQAMAGKWEEKGVLVPGEGAAPLTGVARFVAKPNPDGEGLVLKGKADFGPAKWEYVWIYVAGPADGEHSKLTAVYKDSIGQMIEYEGRIENKIKRLQLIGKQANGAAAKAQITVKEDGSLLVQNVNENTAGEPVVNYSGSAVKAKEEG